MKINYAVLPLVALMALTRVHHFGSALSLPDASLAVFFLAGLCFKSRAILVGLLIEAGALDYLAIHYFSVSDWCISAAYVFLIPTYAVLWLAGRFAARHLNPTLSSHILALGCMLLATLLAFGLSNGSFYLFSGRYANMPVLDYVQRVSHYFGPYVGSAMVYAALGLFVIKTMSYLPALFKTHRA
ncbi:MAG: hypothetical protein WC782_00490 [Methylococcaceae bacterium]|jgi:hypothetical protein